MSDEMELKDLITFLEAEEEKAISAHIFEKHFKELGEKRAQAFRQIRELILREPEQKPEIDDMDEYVEDKAREMFNSDRRLVDFEAFVRRIINDTRGLQVPVVKIKAPIVKPDENEKFPYECCEKCDRLIKQFACRGVSNAIECLYLLSKMKIKKKGGD